MWACKESSAVSSASTRFGEIQCVNVHSSMAGLLGEGSGCPQKPVGVAAQFTAECINSLARVIQPGV